MACGSSYRHLQKWPADKRTAVDPARLLALKPVYPAVLYRTQVNITGHYLSGLLLIKEMPDSSRRVVFSNEAGFKFFDFSFGGPRGFEVIHIMDRLNKKPVIRTLEQDLSLVMMQGIETAPARLAIADSLLYHGFRRGSKTTWYVTDSAVTYVDHAELGAPRKKLVEARWWMGENNVPDSIAIRHFNFNFTMNLKKLER